MSVLELVITAVVLAIGGTGFFFGLRYIIQTGFTKVKEYCERILRGQEYLKEEIQKQESEFKTIVDEVKDNRVHSQNRDDKITNAFQDLSNSLRDLNNGLQEFRRTNSEEHAKIQILFERLLAKLEKE